MTQSIIVYRNPAEAAFWESGMAFPLMVGIVLAVVLTIGVDKLAQRFLSRRAYREHGGTIAVITAISTIVATI